MAVELIQLLLQNKYNKKDFNEGKMKGKGSS
jgi:hypothetical protein